jgi:hypothetical protein
LKSRQRTEKYFTVGLAGKIDGAASSENEGKRLITALNCKLRLQHKVCSRYPASLTPKCVPFPSPKHTYPEIKNSNSSDSRGRFTSIDGAVVRGRVVGKATGVRVLAGLRIFSTSSRRPGSGARPVSNGYRR